MPSFNVEIATGKGLKGYSSGPGRGAVVEENLVKLPLPPTTIRASKLSSSAALRTKFLTNPEHL